MEGAKRSEEASSRALVVDAPVAAIATRANAQSVSQAYLLLSHSGTQERLQMCDGAAHFHSLHPSYSHSVFPSGAPWWSTTSTMTHSFSSARGCVALCPLSDNIAHSGNNQWQASNHFCEETADGAVAGVP